MSGFFKGVLVCLTAGIILTSYIKQKDLEEAERASTISAVEDFEKDVEAGLIIEDGILVNNEEQEFDKGDGNAVGNAAGAVGDAVSSGVSKVLQFFAKLVDGLLT